MNPRLNDTDRRYRQQSKTVRISGGSNSSDDNHIIEVMRESRRFKMLTLKSRIYLIGFSSGYVMPFNRQYGSFEC